MSRPIPIHVTLDVASSTNFLYCLIHSLGFIAMHAHISLYGLGAKTSSHALAVFEDRLG